MNCPKCGSEFISDGSCGSCGIVISKFEGRVGKPDPQKPVRRGQPVTDPPIQAAKERINPYAAPVSPATTDLTSSASYDGTYIHCQDPLNLPDACLTCGSKETNDNRRKKKVMYWVTPAVYLGLLLGFLPVLILYLCLRKKLTITYIQCGSCRQKKTKVILVKTGLWLVNLTMIIMAAVLDSAWLALVSVSGFLVLIVWSIIHAFPLSINRRFKGVFYVKIKKKYDHVRQWFPPVIW